ncbi:kinase-like domain-containing protein [Glomus cerebriforme]|uniref:Kinase-like domain-containing protein n=1 Tax=Glomus cerebriforme TaxID=658196 RepID=A0A397SPF3_9GLOM|nr:kinase-like domain-containing protein [Glomus cerebriforme]
MDRGSLRSHLQNPDLPQQEWSDILMALRDLTRSLASMHKAGLVHRDFHSGNILIKYVNTPYIADFGLSRNVTHESEGKIFGILPYVAPEVLNKQPYTQAADIYSLGMILWEYLANIPPFSDRAHDLRLNLDILRGLRPKILPGTPTIYANLMKQCWDENPEKRPTAQQVNKIISGWQKAYVLHMNKQPLTKEQEEIGKIFEAAEEYRLNIEQGGGGKGKIMRGYAKHSEAWTRSRLLDFPSLEKKSQEPESKIIEEEKESLDKTGYLVIYRNTQLLEISDESDED